MGKSGIGDKAASRREPDGRASVVGPTEFGMPSTLIRDIDYDEATTTLSFDW
jgi:hypothetical protein